MSIRVLLADDQPLVRSGLAMLIDAEVDLAVVGQVSDGAAAVAAAREHQPDVVVMDVRMPGVDGVHATRQICADTFSSDQPVRVLILTAYHVDEAVYAALRAGASGFLLKDAAPQELVTATRIVAAGDAWLDPAVARELIKEFAARPQSDTHTAVDLGLLTDREKDVLRHVARGLSNAEIADALVVTLATVKTHVSRLLLKLGLRDRAQAVMVAYETGFVRPRHDRR